MIKFILWCILLVLCWPLALAALILYPLVWLLLLPFRVVGIAVEGALGLVWAVVTLPLRMARRWCLPARLHAGRDQLDAKNGDGDDEQDVNKSAQGVRRHQAQQPQNQQKNEDSPEHTRFSHLYMRQAECQTVREGNGSPMKGSPRRVPPAPARRIS